MWQCLSSELGVVNDRDTCGRCVQDGAQEDQPSRGLSRLGARTIQHPSSAGTDSVSSGELQESVT